MPLSVNFTVQQSALNPALIIMEDTSTGSDVLVLARRVYFQTTLGTYLVESGTVTDYNSWTLVSNPQSFSVLPQDYALSIRVDWTGAGGAVLYTLTNQYCLAMYGKTFFYYLQQQQSLTPGIVQDSNYFSNMCQFWANIVGAENAVEIGDDIAASQNALDRATYMRNNESIFF